jgi:hypothetical protein
MSDQKQIWRIVVSLLLIVMMLGMTTGMVLHHHANGSDASCPICHLAISPTIAGIRSCVLLPAGAGPGHQSIRSIAWGTQRQVPARAPPA